MIENLLRNPKETWQFRDKRCLRNGAIKPDDFLTELETCHVINRIPGVPVKLINNLKKIIDLKKKLEQFLNFRAKIHVHFKNIRK